MKAPEMSRFSMTEGMSAGWRFSVGTVGERGVGPRGGDACLLERGRMTPLMRGRVAFHDDLKLAVCVLTASAMTSARCDPARG